MKVSKFKNLRMGGFHAMCVFMVVIGNMYDDAGLRDLLIESGISTEGRVEQIFRGKHYNNAMFAQLIPSKDGRS